MKRKCLFCEKVLKGTNMIIRETGRAGLAHKKTDFQVSICSECNRKMNDCDLLREINRYSDLFDMEFIIRNPWILMVIF